MGTLPFIILFIITEHSRFVKYAFCKAASYKLYKNYPSHPLKTVNNHSIIKNEERGLFCTVPVRVFAAEMRENRREM